MNNSITVEQAHQLLEKYVASPAMRYHSLGTEVAMRKMAEKLGQDVDFWGCVGLLHDLDMDRINGDLTQHGWKTVEILKEEGYDIPEMFDAILAHTEVLDFSTQKRLTLLDYLLSGIENLEGFISAYVAVRPSHTIIGAEPKSIVKKLKDKAFANNVNRQVINDAIEQSKLERSEFIQHIIDALSEIADKIKM